MVINQRYELLEGLRDEEGIRSCRGQDLASGQPVEVHLFMNGQSEDSKALLRRVVGMPRGGTSALFDFGEEQGTPYVVTRPLGGSFREWVLGEVRRAHGFGQPAAAAPPPPPPPPPPAQRDPFAHLFQPPVAQAPPPGPPAPGPPGYIATQVFPAPLAAAPPPGPPLPPLPPPRAQPMGAVTVEFHRLFADDQNVATLRSAAPLVPRVPAQAPQPQSDSPQAAPSAAADDPGEFTLMFGGPRPNLPPPPVPKPQASPAPVPVSPPAQAKGPVPFAFSLNPAAAVPPGAAPQPPAIPAREHVLSPTYVPPGSALANAPQPPTAPSSQQPAPPAPQAALPPVPGQQVPDEFEKMFGLTAAPPTPAAPAAASGSDFDSMFGAAQAAKTTAFPHPQAFAASQPVAAPPAGEFTAMFQTPPPPQQQQPVAQTPMPPPAAAQPPSVAAAEPPSVAGAQPPSVAGAQPPSVAAAQPPSVKVQPPPPVLATAGATEEHPQPFSPQFPSQQFTPQQSAQSAQQPAGEFTRMFETPPPQRPQPPAGGPPAPPPLPAGVPQMDRRTMVDIPRLPANTFDPPSSRPPIGATTEFSPPFSDSKSTPQSPMSATVEFHRLFDNDPATQTIQGPTPTQVAPKPGAAPAQQETGEFTRMFQSGGGPQSAPPPAQPPGSFTQMMNSAPPRPPGVRPNAYITAKEGESTQMFQAPQRTPVPGRVPAPPPQLPPQAPQNPPGEFTLMFQRQNTPGGAPPPPSGGPSDFNELFHNPLPNASGRGGDAFNMPGMPQQPLPPPPSQRPREFDELFGGEKAQPQGMPFNPQGYGGAPAGQGGMSATSAFSAGPPGSIPPPPGVPHSSAMSPAAGGGSYTQFMKSPGGQAPIGLGQQPAARPLPPPPAAKKGIPNFVWIVGGLLVVLIIATIAFFALRKH